MPGDAKIVRLVDLKPGQQADCFVLLSGRDRATTRDGKPYYRVTFSDSGRAATAMVWSDSPSFEACDTTWKVGTFYKVRCRLVESSYGLQLELEKIRAVEEADRADGFDETALVKSTRFDIEAMFVELSDSGPGANRERTPAAIGCRDLGRACRRHQARLRGPQEPSRVPGRIFGARPFCDAKRPLSGRQVRGRLPGSCSRHLTNRWSSPVPSCTTSASWSSWKVRWSECDAPPKAS